jgi:hypothetical protein
LLQHLSLSGTPAPKLPFASLLTFCINDDKLFVDIIPMMQFASASIHLVAIQIELSPKSTFDALEYLNGRVKRGDLPVGAIPCPALKFLRMSVRSITWAPPSDIDRIACSLHQLLDERPGLNVEMQGYVPLFRESDWSLDVLVADFSPRLSSLGRGDHLTPISELYSGGDD